MNLAQSVPLALDLEAELVAAYPMLVRRLTLVLRDHDDGHAQSDQRGAYTWYVSGP